MEFGLNESQEILRDSARQFFAGECPMSEVRRLMETDTAFDQKLWKKLAEQGYTGITFPEEAGGVGLGCVELVLLMDFTRKLYAVRFDSTPAEKLGELPAICRGLDIAAVALCAEMVGGMQHVLDLSVEYAKVRKQFGKPIGMFQSVQHHCADMYLETESARSAVYYAAWALEHESPDAAAASSIAKIYTSDAARTVGNRAIQIHGGMGFTWENDIHLYYRRAKSSETMFGDATFHRERLAIEVIDAGVTSAQHA
jgi:alkylation response protein AidB-like acyl-CoA dehydrogenase